MDLRDVSTQNDPILRETAATQITIEKSLRDIGKKLSWFLGEE